MELSKLSPSRGSRQRRTRVGRGSGSGLGKTCGRGHKGQKARTGGRVHPWFEGGGRPMYRKIPKFGFHSQSKVLGLNCYNVINLDTLNKFEDGAIVDMEMIRANGYCKWNSLKAGIKLLARGELTKKLIVRVNAASDAAKEAVEKAGGKLEIV